MNEVVSCGLFILLLDAVLWSVPWLGLVLLQCSTCGGLVAVWTFGMVKWVLLYVVTSILTDGKNSAALHRLVALLCLLSPVVESGRFLKMPPSEPYLGLSPNLSLVMVGQMLSVLACVVWEKGLCGQSGGGNSDLNTKKLLTRVLKYFRPDVLYLIAAFGSLILGVVCDTFIPLYQGNIIDMLRSRQIHGSFLYAVGQLVLVSVGSTLFSGLRGGIFMCTLARLNKRLKHLLFHRLLQQEVNFFDEKENKPGRLSSRLHSDVDKMGRTVALNANAVVRSTVKTCLMLVIMLRLSWELTVLTCIEMPLLAVIQNKYNMLAKELKDQLQDCHAQSKNLASETISRIRTVRSFKAENSEMRRYLDALEEIYVIKRRKGIYSDVFLITRRLVTLVIKVLMLVQARTLISSGHLTIGSLVSFFLYQKPMSTNLREILYCYGDTVSTVGVISKVFSYLDREPRCKEEGHLAPEKLEGEVVFKDVTFSYPSDPDKPTLKSISMKLQPGTMTALVGPSGGGKTSCVSLLKRLYEPVEGQILLDGEPLHHYKHKYFHQKVAVVSQNPTLFSGSLRYNIEYGLQDCDIKKVENAAEKIGADGFISKLEDGYNTDVGECGGTLSEGQKQCVAIIRALVRDPQVIILDEATSKLDVEAQHAALEEVLARGRSVLVVAHQLKTVEKADHIIFLEKGEVVEEGTHTELMAKRGRYHWLKEELFAQSS
ncbi:antigen peptide transporter 2 [Pholidichthys leucotaenia]